MATKLKLLRFRMKEWAREHFGDERIQKSKILAEIQALDRKEESDRLTLEEEKRRIDLKEEFHRKLRVEEISWR